MPVPPQSPDPEHCSFCSFRSSSWAVAWEMQLSSAGICLLECLLV